jgi:hypothetical protein
MKSINEHSQDPSSFDCSEGLKEKKLIIVQRQSRVLSELGKTVAELKSELNRVERLPED